MKYDFPLDNRESISDKMKQVQSVILRMLKILNEICEKHEIPFWLEYGTMLGAVRHNGFIPWDNEADVGMLRADFEKFKEIAQSELPIDIFFQTKETDPFFYPSSTYIEAKLRDKYSNYIEFEKQHPQFKWHNGIQVDIFVYDLVNLNGKNVLLNSFEKELTNCRSYILPQELEYFQDVNFEDTTFHIPIGYDEYLKRNYNDYMKLPPIEDRVSEVPNVFTPCKHSEILHWVHNYKIKK